MKSESLKTPLFNSHKEQGARFVDFAGWKMPFSYTHPQEEHLQVRKQGGLFDVSHMGEIRIRGKDSLPLLTKILPTNTAQLQTGCSQYSILCNEEGGLIDDLIVYAISAGEDYLLCVNSAHKDKDLSWIRSHCDFKNISLDDESDQWGLIAIQGPKSLELCQKVFPSIPLNEIKKFCFSFQEGILFSATGYTGEQGFELYIPWSKTESLWERLLLEGKAFSIPPIGLGARDTLRLERGLLLAGQDFDESRTPWEAGLSRLLKNTENYVGKSKLLQKKGENSESLQRFIIEGDSGVPRNGYSVLSEEGELIGKVTSGAKSPSLEKMIGMAYIRGQRERILLEIHHSRVPSRLVKGAFLQKE